MLQHSLCIANVTNLMIKFSYLTCFTHFHIPSLSSNVTSSLALSLHLLTSSYLSLPPPQLCYIQLKPLTHNFFSSAIPLMSTLFTTSHILTPHSPFLGVICLQVAARGGTSTECYLQLNTFPSVLFLIILSLS